jgi:hypothetical protein
VSLQFLRGTGNCAHPPSTAKEGRLARRKGRGIRRLVSLCRTVTQLVAEYDRHLLESESNDNNDSDDDNGDEDLSPEKKEEIKRYVCEAYD